MEIFGLAATLGYSYKKLALGGIYKSCEQMREVVGVGVVVVLDMVITVP